MLKQLIIKRTINVLFWLIIGSLALGQITRIQLTTRVASYYHELLVVPFIILSFLHSANYRQMLVNFFNKIILKEKLLRLFLFYLIFLVIYQIINGNYLLLAYLTRIFVYWLFAVTIYQKKLIKPYQIWTGLVVIGSTHLAFGIWQYLFLPDMRFLKVFGWDDHYYRLVGLLFDPNFTGLLLILFSLSWWHLTNQFRKLKWLGLILLLASLIVTFSRASYLSAISGTIVLILPNFRKNLKGKIINLLVILLFVTLGLMTAPKPGGEGINLLRTSSIVARLKNDAEWLRSFQLKNWIIGNGLQKPKPNKLNSQKTSYENVQNMATLPNNLFVLITSAVGLLGLILIIKVIGKLKPWEKLNLLQLSAITTVLVHAQFNNSLIHPIILPILLLTIVTLGRPLKFKID